MGLKREFASFLVIGAVVTSSVALADDKAKEHFQKGIALVKEGAFDKAVIELGESYRLNPLPIVLYNLAICHDKLHQYAKAVTYFQQFLDEAKEADAEKKPAVAKRIEKLIPFLGVLDLEVRPAGAAVFINGELVGTAPVGSVILETGLHVIAVAAEGRPPVQQKVTIVSGETVTVTICVEKEPQQPDAPGGGEGAPPAKPTAGTTAGKKMGPAPFAAVAAIAGLSALCAIATGTLALEKAGEVERMYDNTDEWKKVRDEGKRLAVTTDALLGVAAASAVTAVALAVVTDFGRGKKKKTGVAFFTSVNAGSVVLGVGGAF